MESLIRITKQVRDLWLGLWTGDIDYNSQDDDHYRQRVLVMTSTLWLLLVITISVLVRIFVDFTPEGQLAADLLLVITGVTVLISMGLLRVFGSRNLALHVMLLLIAACFTAACFFFGGVRSPTLPALMLIPVTAGIAGRTVSGISWGLIVCVIWVVLFALDGTGYPFTQMIKPENYNIAMLMTNIGMTMTVTCIILVYSEMNKKLRKAQQLANRELETLSRHDVLTGLPNRRYYEEHFDALLGHASDSGTMVGLIFLDLDGFKAINDTYGHGFGDRLLVRVARRLKESLRETDFVARLGGDEFVVLVENVKNPNEVLTVGEKLASAIQRPITIRREVLSSGASFGIAVYPLHGKVRKTLEDSADKAMYGAKKDTVKVALAV